MSQWHLSKLLNKEPEGTFFCGAADKAQEPDRLSGMLRGNAISLAAGAIAGFPIYRAAIASGFCRMAMCRNPFFSHRPRLRHFEPTDQICAENPHRAKPCMSLDHARLPLLPWRKKTKSVQTSKEQGIKWSEHLDKETEKNVYFDHRFSVKLNRKKLRTPWITAGGIS